MLCLSAAVAIATVGVAARRPLSAAAGPRFEISFAGAAHAQPITGRVYVAISKVNDRQAPIQQADSTGAPLFGVNVNDLAAGAAAVIDSDTFGHPVQSLRDIPAGDYWVQPFVNVYTKFARADGHTVWLHMDQWEGQNWRRSPGNIFGDPTQIHFDPASTTPITLIADQGHPAHRRAAGHRLGQAHQDPESDSEQVVGPADLSRRDDLAAEGLRAASERALSRHLLGRPLLARTRRAATAAVGGRGGAPARCSADRAAAAA